MYGVYHIADLIIQMNAVFCDHISVSVWLFLCLQNSSFGNAFKCSKEQLFHIGICKGVSLHLASFLAFLHTALARATIGMFIIL